MRDTERYCDTADEQLFDKIQHSKHYLLHYLLPAPSAASQCYNLRRRPHTRLLLQHRGHLMDSNFITRILYKPFIDAIMKLPTHTLNHGLTDITSLLLSLL